MKKSLIVIHGGATFDTYEEYWKYLESCELTIERIDRKGWKDGLAKELSDFDVLYPKMPNSKNSRYPEWKLWFEKLFHLISDEVVLVGHSLGGIFLVKYLSENNFPKKISQLHIVAAPYDMEGTKDSLADFALNGTVEKIREQVSNIFLYQSKDDMVVDYGNVIKYKKDLPEAKLVEFENRGHFTQLEFPEIVKNIKDGMNA